MKLDVLAIGAHPDDVELCAGGTVCSLVAQGYSVGIVDCTRGELGSRGSADQRAEESAEASRIMGVEVRHNLGLPDAGITNDEQSQRKLITLIRLHQPTLVLANAHVCRHPDHCSASNLAVSAAFYSGLSKIETRYQTGDPQAPWRPQHLLHYMQSVSFQPDLVVDVSDVWDQRMKALLAYRSQFYNPDYEKGSMEEQTYISNPEFLKWVEARARTWGYPRGFTYGEPFLYNNGPIGLKDLSPFLRIERKYV